MKSFLPVFITTCAVFVCFVLMIVPFPYTLGTAGEKYDCLWEDGTREILAYTDALGFLEEIGEDGNLVLSRSDMRGVVESGDEMKSAHAILAGSSLLALRTLDTSNLTALEKTALFRTHGSTVWYVGEPFRFDGTRISPKAAEYVRRVVLLSGALPSDYLSMLGATELHLTGNAELSAAALVGSKVETVTAEAPFCVRGVGIYRETSGGTRLVAALPLVTELIVEDCSYTDRGALLACKNLTTLIVPFAGNSEEGGELAWLFQTASAYSVPENLKSVAVTGGRLVSYCFYNCPNVEEINVCGVLPEDIEAQAFLGVTGLRMLHTPRADVGLDGGFTARTADCGCTIYER